MRRCRRQAPPFSGSAPTTFRLYRYSNEGRPSGSGRNSYVSSNYSNFLSQNSRRKLPRSLPPRRKRNRRLRPPRGDLRPNHTTPRRRRRRRRHPFSDTPLSRTTLSRWRQRCFPSSRGGRGKPTRKFPTRFSYSRNSTLDDVVEGLKPRKSMREELPVELRMSSSSNGRRRSEKKRLPSARSQCLDKKSGRPGETVAHFTSAFCDLRGNPAEINNNRR